LPEGGGAGAPRAVVRCRAYLETIRARPQVGVRGLPPCSRVRPVAIESFQPVLIVNFLRCAEVDAGVAKLDPFRSRRKRERTGWIHPAAVGEGVLDEHRWRGR